MINVLIVDDDAMVAELNRCYVARVQGFHCCGVASNLDQAREMLNDPALAVDLVLLDVYMQQDSGLDLLPDIRATGRPVDVIMISSASDSATVQTSLHYGVVDYLIKPFQFPRFEEALTAWRDRKNQMDSHDYYEQADVDRLLHGGAPEVADSRRLPKGLTAQTLRTLCQWIDAHPQSEFSTDELANAVGISRVSCRKYLIWLAQINILDTSIHYGATGRPLYRYQVQPQHIGLLKQYCQ
ncbi:two-component system response regulator DcuR [Enterobacteriaceae bacterium BIT-l23]|uniref:Transcriptional regulatory protein n=1 Tax=Jejubacter calystegiae TaxID=2579935 RepID=A0A4P8YJ87_9ENTR|nr:two-component system response regulator DcuR [Jejubacter calystegiae]NUU66299.1 two-component system response regulator DcuR [Enterobacteriaceae bacterium BIT-l23]QCT19714.1 two-component system response regulator DcuR [Jejubacter calystegiae]